MVQVALPVQAARLEFEFSPALPVRAARLEFEFSPALIDYYPQSYGCGCFFVVEKLFWKDISSRFVKSTSD